MVPEITGPLGEPETVRLRAERVTSSGTPAAESLVRALYAEHGSALLSFATRLTSDRSRAEDIVQETLLRAWRHADALEPSRGAVRPWLFTIARHIVIDQQRARRARPTEVGDSALMSLPAEDALDRAMESWQVAEALATLRAEHREVLLETYYRGRSVAEAAAALSIPAGTVKSRTYYALRALRLALEERGVTP